MLAAAKTSAHCPTCQAKLRVSVNLPEGKSVRCAGCKTSFRYRSANKPQLPQPEQSKSLCCPACSHCFDALVSADKKLHCPVCRVELVCRKPANAGRRNRDNQVDFVLEVVKRNNRRTTLAPAVDFNDVPEGADDFVIQQTPANRPSNFGDSWPQPQGFGHGQRKSTPAKRRNSRTDKSKPAWGPRAAKVLAVVVGLYFAYSWLFGSPRLDDVSGTITYQGQRINCGSVVMAGDDGVPITGKINPDGTYLVTGVPNGWVNIAVNSMDPATLPEPSLPELSPGGEAAGPQPELRHVPIPGKYASLMFPELKARVSGRTKHDIVLE